MSRITKRAFWVKDDAIYEVDRTHIRFMLDNPGLFNRKKDELASVFIRYGEKIGFEGRAREEIIRSIVEEGWIRIRHYLRPKDYWAVQCSDTPDLRKKLDPVLTELTARGVIHEYDMIAVNGKKISRGTGIQAPEQGRLPRGDIDFDRLSYRNP